MVSSVCWQDAIIVISKKKSGAFPQIQNIIIAKQREINELNVQICDN